MASRKRKKEEELSGWLAVLFFILLAAAIAFPVYLLYSLTSARKRIEALPDLDGNESDFWLDTEEKQQFAEYFRQEQQHAQAIAAAHKLAGQHNVSVNKDGSYSARSKVGKQIRQLLAEHTPLHEQAAARLAETAALPLSRWQQFDRDVRNESSCSTALKVWSAVFFAAMLYFWLSPSDTGSEPGLLGMLFGSGLCAGVIGGAVYAFLYFKQAGAAEYSPKPPLVTAENFRRF